MESTTPVAKDSDCDLGTDTVAKLACRYTFDTINVGDEIEESDAAVDDAKGFVVRQYSNRHGHFNGCVGARLMISTGEVFVYHCR